MYGISPEYPAVASAAGDVLRNSLTIISQSALGTYKNGRDGSKWMVLTEASSNGYVIKLEPKEILLPETDHVGSPAALLRVSRSV